MSNKTPVNKKRILIGVISLTILGLVAVSGFVVHKNLPGQRLAVYLANNDYGAASELLAMSPEGFGVSATLDVFARTYVEDACADMEDVNFVAKYGGLEVLKAALEDRVTLGADGCADRYGAGDISEERCHRDIGRIGSFGMLDGVMDILAAEIDGIKMSKAAFGEGRDYFLSANYKKAMIAFNKIVPKDTESAARAADLRGQCRESYFHGELARVKELFDREQYIAAFHALAQLNELFPEEDVIAALLPSYEQKKNEVRLVDFPTSDVDHIFTHCLVAFPELSISMPGGGTYDKDCLTVTEFKRILEQLYQRNYMLFDINSLYETVDGKSVLKSAIQVPEGKKPFIFSFDDVVYDAKKFGNGMVDKLVVKDGRIQTYTKMPDGSELYSTDNEFIPIMDDFVEEHPDFSWEGAKGTLCMTGFAGILGYRTQSGSPNREAEIEAVKPVVEMLKETGWNFSSHSYGHYDMPKIGDSLFFADVQKWHEEVEPLVGKTSVYVYPFGAWTGYDTAKHQKLMDMGFRIFCGVGANGYFVDGFPKKGAGTGTVFMDRRPMDGYDLRERGSSYVALIDTQTVYDHEARFIKFWESEAMAVTRSAGLPQDPAGPRRPKE
ncbi:MAG: hypothetical protein FWG40_01540 [Peptococcaceae bacterium]|nr:hypothetical protein [Peptococcaceae bacterium]